MQPELQLSAAETLSGIWAALHRQIELAVSQDEVHYLRALALTSDDDLVSSLLLKKLRLARRFEAADPPVGVVMLNSFVEFAFDGGPRRFGQLLHPSPHSPGYGIGITSLLGVGLLGLRAGQTILWPDAGGSLCDLHVARVENCPGMTDWLGGPRG